MPDGGDAQSFPAIVIGHQVTGVKEQAPANYAKRLVEQGYICLTFDAAYQGDSEGAPHGLEDPFQRSDDFRNAVSYLATLGGVDPERIGVLGICGSGGYVPYAAQTDHRMKAVATVVGVDIADFFRQPDPDAFKKMVAEAGKLRSQEAAGIAPKMVEALPQLDQVNDSTPESVREFVDYYKTPRGQHPRSTNRWVERSVDLLDQWSAYADVDKIAPRPLLMVSGSKAETLPYSEKAVKQAGKNAELYVIDGASHVDLYDRVPYLTQAVEKLTDFFNAHLAAR
jgi:fermentation-respiration switch protein FrsA (DUF1100 family)